MMHYHHAVLSVFFVPRCLTKHVQNAGKLFDQGISHGFFNDTEGEDPDKVYGLFLCRVDVQLDLCQSCIKAARTKFRRQCHKKKEAIIWNMYATKETDVSSYLKLYGLVQCTPDLTINSSRLPIMLRIAIAQIPNASGVKQGGKVLTPSSNIRYETYRFYGEPRYESPETSMIEGQGVEPEAPFSSEIETSGTDGQTKWIAMGVTVFGVHLIFSGGVFLWRRRYFQENEDGNSQDIKLIELGGRVDNDYSNENLHVKTGVRSQEFPSSQLEIAVKKLSRSSGLGLIEFKNEVLSITKLQHRNLVRLLVCAWSKTKNCLSMNSCPTKALMCSYLIQLPVCYWIGRSDLASSMTLLEAFYTYTTTLVLESFTGILNLAIGYMAPEYAMVGLFSVKSDVFSFGVLMLEIISSKRNSGFHLWERGESLLTFIRCLLSREWPATQVLRCIHIGLLCVQEDPADRPTMSSVILKLGSETISLPRPAVPAFSVGRVVAEPNQPSSNLQANRDLLVNTEYFSIVFTKLNNKLTSSISVPTPQFSHQTPLTEPISITYSLLFPPTPPPADVSTTRPPGESPTPSTVCFSAGVMFRTKGVGIVCPQPPKTSLNVACRKNRVYSDLTTSDCNTRLRQAISDLPVCCDGKQGGRVLTPRCNIRYELYPFYNQSAVSLPPPPFVLTPPPTSPGKSKKNTLPIIIAVVAPISVSVLLFFLGCCLLKRRKEDKGVEENAAYDISTMEWLQYDLSTIEVATNNFSDSNK
ncbi:hypothetical protein F3Y22_tig00110186pilonHSYRG00076 [Hibiscus syriacus]|uniref:Gnk2-homologous domain-containing protein n=1 Tax=Hibiscus syriacus TaxID=106335 RepID=A0A6A3BDM2_HIBSY|nr:hypothetical protein F3Y22_tig00110186pilonHSYRG00076 [Hibiscus syriacus]